MKDAGILLFAFGILFGILAVQIPQGIYLFYRKVKADRALKKFQKQRTFFTHLIKPENLPDTFDEFFNEIAYDSTGLVFSEVGTNKRYFLNRVKAVFECIKKDYPYYTMEEIFKQYNYGNAPSGIYDFYGHYFLMNALWFKYCKGGKL